MFSEKDLMKSESPEREVEIEEKEEIKETDVPKVARPTTIPTDRSRKLGK